MIERVLDINGRELGILTDARTPRIYRLLTGRDIMIDMVIIQAYQAERMKMDDGDLHINMDITVQALQAFEDLTFVMAKQYADYHGVEIPETADEWLEGYEIMDIYLVMPMIVDIWTEACKTTSTAKKKPVRQSGR